MSLGLAVTAGNLESRPLAGVPLGPVSGLWDNPQGQECFEVQWPWGQRTKCCRSWEFTGETAEWAGDRCEWWA